MTDKCPPQTELDSFDDNHGSKSDSGSSSNRRPKSFGASALESVATVSAKVSRAANDGIESATDSLFGLQDGSRGSRSPIGGMLDASDGFIERVNKPVSGFIDRFVKVLPGGKSPETSDGGSRDVYAGTKGAAN